MHHRSQILELSPAQAKLVTEKPVSAVLDAGNTEVIQTAVPYK